MVKQPKARKPGKRVDGSKATDLSRMRTLRSAARAARLNAPAEEDTRVADAWDRQEGRDKAKAKGAVEAKAIREELARPRIDLQTQSVDNPYFEPAHPAGTTNPKKVAAAVNIRESAIETLYARGQIDQAQKRAADRFRKIWESLGGAGARALDYSREIVDGGGPVEPIKDHQINAGKELEICRELLGARGYNLVCKVCGEGYALGELSATKRDRLTAADNLRTHLDDLCGMWGMANSASYRRTA